GFNAYAFTHGRGAWVVPLFHFAWSGQPASTAPGSTFSATVSAVDANGAAITGYRGTVHFASSDPHPATLPADYTFTAGDNGAHVFSNGFALFTTGTQTITASEVATANSQGLAPATTSVTVSNVIADHLVVSGPVSTAFGTSFSFTVTARDPSNSVDTSPRNVDFSSSDPSAVLPANNSALTSG